MLFMVIERFRDGNANVVYGRFREKGRLMPDGLIFVESPVAQGKDTGAALAPRT